MFFSDAPGCPSHVALDSIIRVQRSFGLTNTGIELGRCRESSGGQISTPWLRETRLAGTRPNRGNHSALVTQLGYHIALETQLGYHSTLVTQLG